MPAMDKAQRRAHRINRAWFAFARRGARRGRVAEPKERHVIIAPFRPGAGFGGRAQAPLLPDGRETDGKHN